MRIYVFETVAWARVWLKGGHALGWLVHKS
jgi:hypothetical protein